ELGHVADALKREDIGTVGILDPGFGLLEVAAAVGGPLAIDADRVLENGDHQSELRAAVRDAQAVEVLRREGGVGLEGRIVVVLHMHGPPITPLHAVSGGTRQVDNPPTRLTLRAMENLRLIALDDTVVFPAMSATLPVDVGDDERVLLVPR